MVPLSNWAFSSWAGSKGRRCIPDSSRTLSSWAFSNDSSRPVARTKKHATATRRAGLSRSILRDRERWERPLEDSRVYIERWSDAWNLEHECDDLCMVMGVLITKTCVQKLNGFWYLSLNLPLICCCLLCSFSFAAEGNQQTSSIWSLCTFSFVIVW